MLIHHASPTIMLGADVATTLDWEVGQEDKGRDQKGCGAVDGSKGIKAIAKIA